jgi:hypothetical protein
MPTRVDAHWHTAYIWQCAYAVLVHPSKNVGIHKDLHLQEEGERGRAGHIFVGYTVKDDNHYMIYIYVNMEFWYVFRNPQKDLEVSLNFK